MSISYKKGTGKKYILLFDGKCMEKGLLHKYTLVNSAGTSLKHRDPLIVPLPINRVCFFGVSHAKKKTEEKSSVINTSELLIGPFVPVIHIQCLLRFVRMSLFYFCSVQLSTFVPFFRDLSRE